MLVPSLVTLAIVFGAVFIYIYVIAPRLNPLRRAENFISQNMVEEAILEYKKILDSRPNDFTVHWKLAKIYYDQKQFDESLLHLEEIIRIGTFTVEVQKSKVLKMLADLYLRRDDSAKVFQNYFELLKTNPTDEDALYHVAFILLGQEYFDAALRHFERLMKVGRKDFEVLFGAGIASFQIQKTEEAAEYFKLAVELNPRSDVANLAMAIVLYHRHDLKGAMKSARAVIDGSDDPEAVFVAKRLYGIFAVQGKKPAEGAAMLEEALNDARGRGKEEEAATLLYDLGFAMREAGMIDQAYEYWNQLYQIDRGYKNVQHLTTLLRKDMDALQKGAGRDREEEGMLNEYKQEWLNSVIPQDFLWNACGLKSPEKIDIGGYLYGARDAKEEPAGTKKAGGSASAQSIDALFDLDTENFRIVANRVVVKLGYRIDEILPTYRESDGVDFMAYHQATKDKTLVWFRRWNNLRVSDITIRNFAQAVNDTKSKAGLFITTSELTDAAREAASRISKVRIVLPDELAQVLASL